MWRYVVVLTLVLIVATIGLNLAEGGNGQVAASASVQVLEVDTAGYAQAIEARDWQFPLDYGAHPQFQTEWWYYTGNLKADDGRHFGFQFTVFRRAINPLLTTSSSEWRTGQVYMAHFTLSDVDNEAFYHAERYSRGGAGLAGALPVVGDEATSTDLYRVWLEDWQVQALTADATLSTIQAATTATDGTPFAVDLTLQQIKPPALQGEDGLSPKSDEIGNASYYYTLSRLLTEGTITIGAETFHVTGNTWKDHEFSTSALGNRALGWDWFGLIFDDDHELMIGQIRLLDGGRDSAFGGLMIYPDGTTRYLPAESFTIESTDTWVSPHTGATYPAGWVITIAGDLMDLQADFTITVTPLTADQELNSGDIAYWEGAVRITGDATGYGYAELTGYVDQMTGRF